MVIKNVLIFSWKLIKKITQKSFYCEKNYENLTLNVNNIISSLMILYFTSIVVI